MQRSKSESPSDISRELLNYLLKHPEAQDTLEGICQWWLLKQTAYREFVRVRDTLDRLASEGLVTRKLAVDGRVHYRINKRKQKTILKLLDELH